MSNAPIGLYFHIPFCQRKCAYCDFASFPGRGDAMALYCVALMRELAAQVERYGRRPVSSVFFGGGTPSLLSGGQITALLDAARAAFEVLPDAEITMEGNPGTLRPADVTAYRAAGVNRFSLGAQAAQDGLLKALGRIHRWADVERGVTLLRAAGFDNISLDLMFGLPGQTLTDWEQTVRAALALGPAHLSCYGLQVEEGTPLGKRLALGVGTKLPDEDDERALYHLARRIFAEAGLAQYEISNFGRPGRESRHNLLYWQGGEYLGLGCAAHSHLQGQRFGNTPDLDEYLRALQAGDSPESERTIITEEDARFEALMLGLRLTQGVNIAAFAARFGQPPQQVWGEALQAQIDAGLLYIAADHLRLTERGQDLQNTVLVALLA